MANYIPDGFHTVTPFLVVRDAPKVIAFLQDAFNAKPMGEPALHDDGTIMHAQVKIGDSVVMLVEENDMAEASSTTLYLYVSDVDAMYQRAVKAGGKSIMEPMDMFYGDRSGGVMDPSGNKWFVATHKEDIAPQELVRRAAAHNKRNVKTGGRAAQSV